MQFLPLLKKHKDGATFSPLDFTPQSFRHGFAVSLTDNPIIFNIITEPALQQHISRLDTLASSLHLNRYFYGWWLDKKTNIGYLDLSIIAKTKRMALKLARLYKQKAIFDFSTFQSVYL